MGSEDHIVREKDGAQGQGKSVAAHRSMVHTHQHTFVIGTMVTVTAVTTYGYGYGYGVTAVSVPYGMYYRSYEIFSERNNHEDWWLNAAVC